MTKYLISFPSGAMDVADEDLQAVSDAARSRRFGNLPDAAAVDGQPRRHVHPRHGALRPHLDPHGE